MDQRLLQRFLGEAQKSKKQHDENLKKLQNTVFEHKYGNNHVNMKVRGDMEFISIKFSEELFKDKEMLEDLIVEAVNEIIKKISDEKQKLDEKLMPKI